MVDDHEHDGVQDRPRLLFLTSEAPWPPSTGQAIRNLQMLSSLAERFEVHLAAFTDGDPLSAMAALRRNLPCLAGLTIERHAIRLRRSPLKLAFALAGSFAAGRPYSISKFRNDQFDRRLQAVIQETRPSLIVTSLPMSPYVMGRSGDARIVLDAHNVEHRLWAEAASGFAGARRLIALREASRLNAFEIDAWNASDLVSTICEEDQRLIAPLTSTPLHVWPAAMEAVDPPRAGDFRYDVGLLGVWSWAPNEDAISWFSREIAPALGQHGVRMAVAGRALAKPERRRLKALGVDVLGHVDSLNDFYASTRTVLAPYRLGGGVRLKVLEALVHAKPVIGTRLAFRGIQGLPPTFPLSADDAEGLISRVIRALENFEQTERDAALLQSSVMTFHGPRQSQIACDQLVGALAMATRVR